MRFLSKVAINSRKIHAAGDHCSSCKMPSFRNGTRLNHTTGLCQFCTEAKEKMASLLVSLQKLDPNYRLEESKQEKGNILKSKIYVDMNVDGTRLDKSFDITIEDIVRTGNTRKYGLWIYNNFRKIYGGTLWFSQSPDTLAKKFHKTITDYIEEHRTKNKAQDDERNAKQNLTQKIKTDWADYIKDDDLYGDGSWIYFYPKGHSNTKVSTNGDDYSLSVSGLTAEQIRKILEITKN